MAPMAALVQIVNQSAPEDGDCEDPLAREEDHSGSSGGDDDDLDITNQVAISKPGEHDVLLGRGGGTNNHCGNVQFRKLVNEHKMRYLAAPKTEKPKVAREVVQLWRKLDPPGRFLARKGEGSKKGPGSVKAVDNVWYEVGDRKAREKASQCLRERTPDVMPYLRQLREQQDAMTEQGVSMVQRQLQMQDQRQQQQQVGTILAPHHASSSAGVAVDPAMYGGPHHTTASMSMHAYGDGMQVLTTMPISPDTNIIYVDRRTNLPLSPVSSNNALMNHYGNMAAVAAVPGYAAGVGSLELAGDDLYGDGGDYGEIEYQQRMMLLQQQLQLQQLEMAQLHRQRIQQRNLQHRAAAAAALQMSTQLQQSRRSPTTTSPSGQTPPHLMSMALGRTEPVMHHYPEPPIMATEAGVVMVGQCRREDPAATTTSTATTCTRPPRSTRDMVAAPTAATTLSPRTVSKRHRDQQQQQLPPAPTDRALPERAPTSTSLMSLQETDGELTLEEYRLQLEKYMEDNRIRSTLDDTGVDSDLEDDWEKEKEKAAAAASNSKRGVGRNESGMSFMTTNTAKSGMSVVSGISLGMFSDMSNDKEAEKDIGHKSIASIMSDMTDLSENIDNLSLYDE